MNKCLRKNTRREAKIIFLEEIMGKNILINHVNCELKPKQTGGLCLKGRRKIKL
jgi:hypothetical protein